MKKPNRQMLLAGGAVACLLIALATLFSGSGSEPSAAAPEGDSAPQQEASLPLEGAADNATSPALNPEFFQRVRQQLLSIPAEHEEPFVVRDRAVSAPVSPDRTDSQRAESRSLPVLPLTLQPTWTNESPPHPPSSPTGGDMGQPDTHQPSQVAQAQAQGGETAPRLRGTIRYRDTSKMVVLFELNGALQWASNEPSAEWRIIKMTPRQITVRNGERTLVLEVPYAR
jgi:hypothetical protein